MRLRPYTDHEWDNLPHVIMTSENTWDPSILDHDLDQDDEWFDTISDRIEYPSDQRFDEFGDFKRRVEIASSTTKEVEYSIDTCVLYHTNNQLLRGNDLSKINENEYFFESS